MDSSDGLTTIILLFLFIIYTLRSLRSFRLFERCRKERSRCAQFRRRPSHSHLTRLGVQFCLFFATTVIAGVACFFSLFHHFEIDVAAEQKEQTVTARNDDESADFDADTAEEVRFVQVSEVSSSDGVADSISNGRRVRIISMPLILTRVSDFEKEGVAF